MENNKTSVQKMKWSFGRNNNIFTHLVPFCLVQTARVDKIDNDNVTELYGEIHRTRKLFEKVKSIFY